jgi:hypothetical protein
MERYWIKFDISLKDSPPVGILQGIGVTANDLNEAKKIIRDQVFKGKPLPKIKTCSEDIDISKIENEHILLNMGNSAKRGIWYPLGYSY